MARKKLPRTRKSRATRTPSKAPKEPLVVGHPTKPFTLLAAAPTASVAVSRTQKGGALVGAKLNDKSLNFVNDIAHAVVRAGQLNTLAWVAVGPPGSGYTIQVTQPATAHCAGGSTLDDSGKDAGSCDFNT